MSISLNVDSTRTYSAYTKTSSTSKTQGTAESFAASLESASSALIASPQEKQDYARDLTRRFKEAGIDTSKPISLTTTQTGAVVAKDGTPDKEKIDALFASDPALANQYRKIASTELLQAMGTEYAPYAAAYQAAGSDAARGAVWQRYQGAFNSIEAAGNDLTLSNDTLTSRAVEIAQKSAAASTANGLPAQLVAQIERSNQESLMDTIGGGDRRTA